jgi:hypothetical protein
MDEALDASRMARAGSSTAHIRLAIDEIYGR